MLCCLHPDCQNLPERNGYCSSCNRRKRKEETDALKPKKVYTIPKVGEKRKKELPEYSKLKKKFLQGRWCALHGQPCIPEDIYHSAGKVGYIDQWASDNGVTAFMDVRYWVALCRKAHEFIELNPKLARESGLSESRLSKK